MAPQLKLATLTNFRGGRNGYDPPLSIRPPQVLDVVNMDYSAGGLGKKRNGSSTVSLTCSSGGPFAGEIGALARHVPAGDETAQELWAVDVAGGGTQLFRLAGATTWTEPTLVDAFQSLEDRFDLVSFFGNAYMAYNSAVDRLHCWDPVDAKVRRVGLATPAVPTVANTGGGATYPAIIRYYRVRYTKQIAGATVLRSEHSTSVSFTPSGAGDAARVTKPASISEDETHWELEASADNTNFFRIATTAVGTTTYDDSAAPTTYFQNTASATSGLYTVPKSWKVIAADGGRLLGLGSWETPAYDSRFWYTEALGTLDVGDCERVPETSTRKNWIDLDDRDGGTGVGIKGPMNGSVYVFKTNSVYEMVPTGEVNAPYRPFRVMRSVGCVYHKSIVLAEDAAGRPAIYWWSHRGPYRIGVEGPQYLGMDIHDLIFGPTSTVNLSATIVAHGIYHREKNQIWYWISTGAATVPDALLVLHIDEAVIVEGENVRGGWVRVTGDLTDADCSVMFASTIAASMSVSQKPYIGRATSDPRIRKLDDSSTTTDVDGGNFQAYVDLPPLALAGPHRNFSLENPYLLAVAASGVTIRLTLTGSFGLESRTADVVLTASGSETRVRRKFESGELSDAWTVQPRLGDSAAASNAWTLDGLILPYREQEWA